jgi:hypothetical protein
MRKDVQRMPKFWDQSERKHTQHNMIERAKCSVCVFDRESRKLTSGVVHTRPDVMLSNKRSTESSASGRKNMSVRTLHTRS